MAKKEDNNLPYLKESTTIPYRDQTKKDNAVPWPKKKHIHKTLPLYCSERGTGTKQRKTTPCHGQRKRTSQKLYHYIIARYRDQTKKDNAVPWPKKTDIPKTLPLYCSEVPGPNKERQGMAKENGPTGTKKKDNAVPWPKKTHIPKTLPLYCSEVPGPNKERQRRAMAKENAHPQNSTIIL
ncbi:unnamed protein product [Mytilus coruscus]|uniref:Uncharacterized protein n=1 Tax=Mytilus coruscus TaxID=42192 RepID=A0A6J8B0Y6_MYTCO|nr:unnamed protein product [Mytilus coruscus]